jgi:hypothetical protein
MVVDPTFPTFPIHTLRSLTEKDPELVRRNKRQARALLSDQFPEYALQVAVLSGGLEMNVPDALKRAAERGALTIEAGRLAQALVSRYGYQEYIARWAIAAWAFSLGYWDEQHVSSTLMAEKTPEKKAAAPTLGASPAAGAGQDAPDRQVVGEALDSHEKAPPPSDAPEQPPVEPSSRRGIGQPKNILILALVVLVLVVGAVVGAHMTNAFGPSPTPTPVPTATPVPTSTPVPNAAPALTAVETMACWGSAPDNIAGCPPHSTSVGPCYQGNPQWSQAAGCPVTTRLQQRLRQNPTSGSRGGADPICRCQNVPSRLDFRVIQKSNQHDLINVIWPWRPNKAVITFAVVNKSGEWFVDDMYCAGYPGTSIYSSPVTNCA